MGKCKYYKICIVLNHYRKDSFTCNNGGGSYCGLYREFEKIKIKKRKLKKKKEEFILNG